MTTTTVPVSAVPVSGVAEVEVMLDQVVDLVTAAQERVAGLSGAQSSRAIRKVSRVIIAVEALKVELVGQFNKSRVWDSGARDASPEKVLAREHLLDAGQAVRDVKAAAAFDVFPELRDAAGQGRISREKADTITAIIGRKSRTIPAHTRKRSSTATAAASSHHVTGHPAGPKPTTSNTGATVAKPHSRIWPYSAVDITIKSTQTT